jgi:hypothetical protein
MRPSWISPAGPASRKGSVLLLLFPSQGARYLTVETLGLVISRHFQRPMASKGSQLAMFCEASCF